MKLAIILSLLVSSTAFAKCIEVEKPIGLIHKAKVVCGKLSGNTITNIVVKPEAGSIFYMMRNFSRAHKNEVCEAFGFESYVPWSTTSKDEGHSTCYGNALCKLGQSKVISSIECE